MNETIEIIKEARKAGMQTALMLFGALLVVSALFGYYIYKSYDSNIANISAIQDGTSNIQEITNGDTVK